MYRFPAEVWRMIGKELTYGLPVQMANEAKYNLFLYDNEKLCICSYRPYYESAELIVKGDEYEAVRDIESGMLYTPHSTRKGPGRRGDSATTQEEPVERVYHIPMAPGGFRFLELIRRS